MEEKNIIYVAAEFITDQEAGCAAGKGAENLEVGSKTLFLERVEDKFPCTFEAHHIFL